MKYREYYLIKGDSATAILMNYPDLKFLRDTISARNNLWTNELALRQRAIVDSIKQIDEEYVIMHTKAINSLRECNIQIFSYFTTDFIEKDIEIPVGWIQKDELETIKKQSKIQNQHSLFVNRHSPGINPCYLCFASCS